MKNLCALMVVLLGGCAGDATKPDYEAQEESIDQILTQPLAENEYAEQVRCLATYTYNSVEILDSRHVVFKGPGGRYWLNRLRNRCLGLRRNDTLKFELRTSQICDLDTFEAISIAAWQSDPYQRDLLSGHLFTDDQRPAGGGKGGPGKG